MVLLLATCPSLGAHDVVAWNELMLEAIRVDTSMPCLAARNLAILNGGLFDVVNSLEPTHQPYLEPVPGDRVFRISE